MNLTQTSDTSAEISVTVSSTDKVSSQKSATKILKSLSKQMEIVQNDIGESAAISYDIVVKTPVENSIPTDETTSNVKGERTFSRSQTTVENHIPVNETNSEQSNDTNAPTIPIPSRILSSELNNGVNATPSVQTQLADIKVNTDVNLSETSSVSTVINHNESIVRDENTREKEIASNVTTLHHATKNERSFNADEVPDIPVDEDSTLPLTNSTSLKSLLKNAQDLGLNVQSVVIRIDSQEIPIEHTGVMPLSYRPKCRNGEKHDIGIELSQRGQRILFVNQT
ncbi:MAG: hypothetical protein IPM69_10815 [Ignavibacteria bacterium]|nr:hypothetical protein [Ignavibacteria bacterium]